MCIRDRCLHPRRPVDDYAPAARRRAIYRRPDHTDLRESIFLADEVIVLSGRPATVQYRQALPQRGPRNLDQLYTPEAMEMLNILREQIRIARESEDAGA